MASRKTPYGYKITDGKLNIVNSEANVVLKIFNDKLNGVSGTQIASELYKSAEPYFAEDEKRASDRVYSILSDNRYFGTDGFPQIIDKDTFEKARRTIKKSDKTPKNDTYSLLKKLSYCAECGKGLVRFSCRTGIKQWRCSTKGCANCKPSLTDDELYTAINTILKQISADPELLETGEVLTEYIPVTKVMRIENEIARLKAMQPIDYDAIKREILALAAAKYECCTYSRVPYITEELTAIVSSHQPTEDMDTEYIQRIVSRISVDGKKNISIEFINGKVITYERNGEHNA